MGYLKRFEIEEMINKLELFIKSVNNDENLFFYKNTIENLKIILKNESGITYGKL